ncbi:MAG: hypothetical protein VW338_15740 [Rhodospirillaceae bacterium]
MTTLTPLPSWPDLLAGLAGGRPAGDALAAPWLGGGARAFRFSRSAWALHAIAAWWRQTHSDAAPRLWLPDYFCNQSTEPLSRTGASLRHYPVADDLEPDWPACRAMLADGPAPDLFVLTHYFGHAADGARAAAFCGEAGALLIEDAAHALAPGNGIGDSGDFVLYSPHKLLAVPEVALLVARGADHAAAVASAVATLPPGRSAAGAKWLATRAVLKLLPGFALARRYRALPGFDYDPPYGTLATTPFAGAVAERLLARQSADLADVAARRRSNAESWRRYFQAKPDCGVPLFTAGAEGAAPYRFVQRFADAAAAEKWFGRFRARGVPVETWPDLAPEVLADPARHGRALELRRRLVLFPVHQTLTFPRNL